jgi:fermentation-respiration switch protein FrsA (DUF1100 family)
MASSDEASFSASCLSLRSLISASSESLSILFSRVSLRFSMLSALAFASLRPEESSNRAFFSEARTLSASLSFSEASSLNQIAKAQVPVLFIHGSEDNFVHTDMVYRVYDACPTEKQLFVVEGAGHGNSFNHMPDKYFETVFSFLDRFQLN